MTHIAAPRELIDREAVCRILGMSLGSFYKRSRKMMEEEGFPPPARGRQKGARWDPKAIELWQNSRIPTHLRPGISNAGDRFQSDPHHIATSITTADLDDTPDDLDAILAANAADL